MMVLKKRSIKVKFEASHAMEGFLIIHDGLKRHTCGHSGHHREHFLVVRCFVFKLLEDYGAQLATVSAHLKGNILALLLVLLC